MKTWQILLAGVLIGLLASGLIYLVSSPIRGQPVTLSPAPSATTAPKPTSTSTPAPILVQVGGQVRHPGIYQLSPRSRLSDLIDQSGGLLEDADMPRINLAALCADGDYYYIPAVGENIPETANNAPQNIHLQSTPDIIYPLDLNQATQEQLESLPGIGPGKAADIIAYREINGAFTSIDDLLNVEGIGPKTLETLSELIIVGP